jgi:Rrf2 family protein
MLSNSCKYGIRSVIYLAKNPLKNGNIGIKKISEDLGLPTPFMAKILQLLAKQKILTSSKGPHGGFSLLKDPRNITLLDIVNTIDGEGFFNNCVMHNGLCVSTEKKMKQCTLHDDYSKTREDLKRLFSNMTIYDLAAKADNSELIVI